MKALHFPEEDENPETFKIMALDFVRALRRDHMPEEFNIYFHSNGKIEPTRTVSFMCDKGEF